jgi:hypothetical protein
LTVIGLRLRQLWSRRGTELTHLWARFLAPMLPAPLPSGDEQAEFPTYGRRLLPMATRMSEAPQVSAAAFTVRPLEGWGERPRAPALSCAGTMGVPMSKTWPEL